MRVRLTKLFFSLCSVIKNVVCRIRMLISISLKMYLKQFGTLVINVAFTSDVNIVFTSQLLVDLLVW